MWIKKLDITKQEHVPCNGFGVGAKTGEDTEECENTDNTKVKTQQEKAQINVKTKLGKTQMNVKTLKTQKWKHNWGRHRSMWKQNWGKHGSMNKGRITYSMIYVIDKINGGSGGVNVNRKTGYH
jgi:hypothetical protein